MGTAVGLGETRSCAIARRRPVEEKRRRHFEHARELLEPACADSIRALFIFLNLLKRHIERFTELTLAHSDHQPAHAHPGAHMLIDGIWNLNHSGNVQPPNLRTANVAELLAITRRTRNGKQAHSNAM